MPLSESLKKSGAKIPAKRKGPVWEGPDGRGPNGGITQSLLSRFLCCRERFRLRVVEGLKPADQFEHRLEYGQMWHTCEEALAAHNSYAGPLQEYARGLCKKYPTSQEQIDHWYRVCKVQFPLYVDYWRKHPDVKNRVPIAQEQVFDVPYQLPSGRVVRLRGKWDAIDLIKKEGIYVGENKTKGDIVEQKMLRQLSFDLQNGLYLVALKESQTQAIKGEYALEGPMVKYLKSSIAGVRYNVVRRPLSGGAGSIHRHQPTKSNPDGESKDEFYARVGEVISGAPETYFMRWKVTVTPDDIERFRVRCLNPILESLWDWWEWITTHPDPWSDVNAVHWQHPFGVYNILDEGGSSDLDEYISSGNEVGLVRSTEMFRELR
jgi:hypothetical protein